MTNLPNNSDQDKNIKDKLPVNIKAYSQTKMKKKAFKIFDNLSNSDNVKNALKNL
jgi:hypothetical protein